MLSSLKAKLKNKTVGLVECKNLINRTRIVNKFVAKLLKFKLLFKAIFLGHDYRDNARII